MRVRRPAAVALAAVLAVTAAGCRGGKSEEDAVVESLQLSLLRDQTFESYEISDEEAFCVARRVVDEIGAERMTEIGAGDTVDFGELTDQEITALGTAMETCVNDIDAVLVDAITAGILEDPDPDFPVEEEEARCVAEAMARDFDLSRMVLLGVRGGDAGNPFVGLEPAEIEIFADAMVGCIDVRQILLDGIASSGADEEAIACLDANITDDDIRNLFTAAFSGQDSDAAAAEILGPSIEACS